MENLLASVPAAALLDTSIVSSMLSAAGRPNSLIGGVQIGTINNDAGVKLYAWKCLNPNMSDEEFEYAFNVAEALGCTHTTLEVIDADAQLKRVGAFARRSARSTRLITHTRRAA